MLRFGFGFGFCLVPSAFHFVSASYVSGLAGLHSDSMVSLKWWRKAADQGYAVAQSYVANYYATGLGGLSKDEVEALKWYRKAAAQGEAAAIADLRRLGLQ